MHPAARVNTHNGNPPLQPPTHSRPTPKIQSPERIYCAFRFSLSVSLLQIFTCAYEDKIQSCICTSRPIVEALSALPSFQIFPSLCLPPSLCPSPLLHFKRNSSGATKAPSQKWRAPNETQRILNAGEFLRVHQTCKAAALKIFRSSFRARLRRQPRLPLLPPSPQQGRSAIC